MSCMNLIVADPNYAQPWQMRPQRSSSGSAFIVDTKRRHIMTNAHVVCALPASMASVLASTQDPITPVNSTQEVRKLHAHKQDHEVCRCSTSEH